MLISFLISAGAAYMAIHGWGGSANIFDSVLAFSEVKGDAYFPS